jgi:Mn2+/Fe2+ NRAMP family transporter
VLLPITLIAIARLVGDRAVLGDLASRGFALWILWATAALLSALSVALLVVTVTGAG